MKFITDDTSNCYAACISTLTGIPFDALRLTEYDFAQPETLFDRLKQTLSEHGHIAVRTRDEPPKGFALAAGRSPRGAWNHAVIVYDGLFYHDPHPSRLFIETVSYYEVFPKRN